MIIEMHLIVPCNFRAEVEEIFKEKDRDLDGTMSYDEFTGHDTKTEIAFKAIDKNGDGFVSKVIYKHEITCLISIKILSSSQILWLHGYIVHLLPFS